VFLALFFLPLNHLADGLISLDFVVSFFRSSIESLIIGSISLTVDSIQCSDVRNLCSDYATDREKKYSSAFPRCRGYNLCMSYGARDEVSDSAGSDRFTNVHGRFDLEL
jgi:hypothetical protein